MKIRIPLYLCFCISAAPLLSQNKPCDCCVSGEVLDANTKEPIPFATVQVQNTEKYAQTTIDGNFIINGICPDNYTLVISCLGYSEAIHGHHHEQDGRAHFYLTKDITGLDEVTLQVARNKEKGTETMAQTTLGKEEIKSNPTQTLAASIAQIEGVTFASTGTNVQLPIIHGLSGNRILVLNNGLKHAFQNWGSEHAPEIDINALNNITVIKGAGGVRFGPEALSGVILTAPNPLLLNNPFYTNVSMGFQTNGRGGNTNFEIGNGTEKWSYFLNGSYTKIGDRKAPAYNLTNTGKIEGAFSLGTRYHLDTWDFKAYYSFIDQNLGLLRASFPSSTNALIRAFNSPVPVITEPFSYDISDPNETTQHHLGKVEIDWRYADDAKLTFRAGVQFNNRQEFAVRRNEDRPIIDLDLLTFDYQLEWEHPTWNGLDGFIGLQYFNQNNDNNPGTFAVPFIPNYNTERFSLFAVEKVTLGNNTLEAGVRFDVETNDVRGENNTTREIFRDRYTFSNFTASLGYQWNLDNISSFKTNLGSAFRTPNTAELFGFGQQGFFTTYGLLRFSDANGGSRTSRVIPLEESDVGLEKSYKLTNEFKTSNTTNAHAITGYINYIENFVFQRPIGINKRFRGPTVTFFVDQQDALFLGLDYTWKKELTEHFSTTYGLSYLWSKNIGKNEPLINQPPITTNLQLEWKQGNFWVFEASKWILRPSYTFKQFQAPRTIPIETIDDGSANITTASEIFDLLDAPDGYFLLDLSWNYQCKKIRGSITAKNLLNTRYRDYLNELRYFADDVGTNILFTLNYSF